MREEAVKIQMRGEGGGLGENPKEWGWRRGENPNEGGRGEIQMSRRRIV